MKNNLFLPPLNIHMCVRVRMHWQTNDCRSTSEAPSHITIHSKAIAIESIVTCCHFCIRQKCHNNCLLNRSIRSAMNMLRMTRRNTHSITATSIDCLWLAWCSLVELVHSNVALSRVFSLLFGRCRPFHSGEKRKKCSCQNDNSHLLEQRQIYKVIVHWSVLLHTWMLFRYTHTQTVDERSCFCANQHAVEKQWRMHLECQLPIEMNIQTHFV